MKAKVGDFIKIKGLLKKNGARFKGILRQKDVYFRCKSGRLKIREINNKEFNLIYYNRPNKLGSKISDCLIVKVDKINGLALEKICTTIFDETAIVQKEQSLWLYKHTRIHFDKVCGLGNFVELETVIRGISMVAAIKERQFAEIVSKMLR